MHTHTASSYGVIDARQSKAKKNKNTINVACLERGKSKQNSVSDELPFSSKVRAHHGRKGSVFSSNSVSKPLKRKGCLTYELMSQKFSEFLKHLDVFLSLSHIPEHHIIRLKNRLNLDRQVYVSVKLLCLSFLAFCMANGN